MTLSFTQTDTVAVCGVATYCSAASLNGVTTLRQATVGGTPGVTTVNNTIGSTATNVICLFFECIVPPNVNWSSGTWTVNLNITAGGGLGSSWAGFDICRVNSGCVNQALIASVTNTISINSIGIKTQTATGSVQTPNPGDKIMVLLRFSVVSNGTIHYKPDQNIDSPFDIIPVTMTFLGNF
jgi:hypothetical protein